MAWPLAPSVGLLCSPSSECAVLSPHSVFAVCLVPSAEAGELAEKRLARLARAVPMAQVGAHCRWLLARAKDHSGVDSDRAGTLARAASRVDAHDVSERVVRRHRRLRPRLVKLWALHSQEKWRTSFGV